MGGDDRDGRAARTVGSSQSDRRHDHRTLGATCSVAGNRSGGGGPSRMLEKPAQEIASSIPDPSSQAGAWVAIVDAGGPVELFAHQEIAATITDQPRSGPRRGWPLFARWRSIPNGSNEPERSPPASLIQGHRLGRGWQWARRAGRTLRARPIAATITDPTHQAEAWLAIVHRDGGPPRMARPSPR